MAGLKLNDQVFPFAKTPQGEKYCKQLNVTMKAVEQEKQEALKRYSYCMAAGAAEAEGKAFPFTVEQFIKACPPDWKARTIELYNAKAEAKAEPKKKS